MFIFNVANPITLILLLAITLILIFLGKETKKGYFTAISLIVFLVFLIWHVGQILTIAPEYEDLRPTLTSCLIVDFVMILLSFLYLIAAWTIYNKNFLFLAGSNMT